MRYFCWARRRASPSAIPKPVSCAWRPACRPGSRPPPPSARLDAREADALAALLDRQHRHLDLGARREFLPMIGAGVPISVFGTRPTCPGPSRRNTPNGSTRSTMPVRTAPAAPRLDGSPSSARRARARGPIRRRPGSRPVTSTRGRRGLGRRFISPWRLRGISVRCRRPSTRGGARRRRRSRSCARPARGRSGARAGAGHRRPRVGVERLQAQRDPPLASSRARTLTETASPTRSRSAGGRPASGRSPRPGPGPAARPGRRTRRSRRERSRCPAAPRRARRLLARLLGRPAACSSSRARRLSTMFRPFSL